MTMIEELKAAYGAATQGEWGVVGAAIYKKSTNLCVAQCYVTESNPDTEHVDNANLIALMHNTLPALLEAVEALKTIVDSEEFHGDTVVCDFESLQSVARHALEKLK